MDLLVHSLTSSIQLNSSSNLGLNTMRLSLKVTKCLIWLLTTNSSRADKNPLKTELRISSTQLEGVCMIFSKSPRLETISICKVLLTWSVNMGSEMSQKKKLGCFSMRSAKANNVSPSSSLKVNSYKMYPEDKILKPKLCNRSESICTRILLLLRHSSRKCWSWVTRFSKSRFLELTSISAWSSSDSIFLLQKLMVYSWLLISEEMNN